MKTLLKASSLFLFICFVSGCANPPLNLPFINQVQQHEKTPIDGIWENQGVHFKIESGIATYHAVHPGAIVKVGMVAFKSVREKKFPLFSCNPLVYKIGTTTWAYTNGEIEVLNEATILIRSFPDGQILKSTMTETWNKISLDDEGWFLSKLEESRYAKTNIAPHKESTERAKIAEKGVPIIHSGTGFIINSNGYLITNYHVVKDAKDIKVKTTGGGEINAVLIMKDVSNDIAVLKVSSAPASINSNLYFGDSSKMKVGDKVSTIGYPFSNILGQQPRYSEGIINSLYGVQDDPRLFQISVPIQSGNSGGPLFNEKGEVIGIVVASLDAKNVFEITGSFPQNISFAIKSAYIKNLISMMPNLGSALVMPTDLSLARGESKSFIERAKNNIVLIEAK